MDLKCFSVMVVFVACFFGMSHSMDTYLNYIKKTTTDTKLTATDNGPIWSEKSAKSFLLHRTKRGLDEECRERCDWHEVTEKLSFYRAQEFMKEYNCRSVRCSDGYHCTNQNNDYRSNNHLQVHCTLACTAGQYIEGDTCENCPKGYYQSSIGGTTCTACPGMTTTPTDGSTSVAACTETCQLGSYLENKECIDCPAGTFQNTTGQSFCYSCPDQSPLSPVGAVKSEECVDYSSKATGLNMSTKLLTLELFCYILIFYHLLI